MWFWTLASLGLAGILDLAVGALIVHLLSEYFVYPLVWWQYAIGALLGASPDLDLFYAFWSKTPNGHHEFLTHRPIVGIPLAATIGWLLGGEFWAWCAGGGVFWHYLHDTKGFLCLYDSGLAWLWPFSRKYWGVKNLRVVSETLGELFSKEKGFESIHATYLTPTRRSITEFLLMSIAMGYVVADVFGTQFGVAIVLLFWSGILGLWMMYANYCAQTHR